jgi:hypothetical protein
MTKQRFASVAVILVVIGIAGILGFFGIKRSQERELLKLYLGDPIPESVNDLAVDTVQGPFGTSVDVLTFRIAPEDLALVLHRKGFTDVTADYHSRKDRPKSEWYPLVQDAREYGVTANRVYESIREFPPLPGSCRIVTDTESDLTYCESSFY